MLQFARRGEDAGFASLGAVDRLVCVGRARRRRAVGRAVGVVVPVSHAAVDSLEDLIGSRSRAATPA
jgi:hypothetical protein